MMFTNKEKGRCDTKRPYLQKQGLPPFDLNPMGRHQCYTIFNSDGGPVNPKNTVT